MTPPYGLIDRTIKLRAQLTLVALASTNLQGFETQDNVQNVRCFYKTPQVPSGKMMQGTCAPIFKLS
jgi:hypothetical protein